MCSRRLKAGADWITTANTVEQASEVRHALVKQLYSYLFLWLVRRINDSLAQPPEQLAEYVGTGAGPHIAYVDIFGFEIFETNSLEQLCINFANEKLQRLFVGVLFESVHQMYDEEGITVEKIEYSDNKRVVDLIGGAPSGLLAMLTEECVFPKGSDTSYLQKVVTAFSKHQSFIEVKTSPSDFGIKHFAGDVTYSVHQFLEKNKDPISQDLQVLVEFSDDPFVAAMMKTAKEVVAEEVAAAAADGVGGGGTGSKFRDRGGGSKMRSGKFVGVADGFKSSLRRLISTLQGGELHFIRCLKPNDSKAPDMWDRDVAHRQLMSAGLVQAVAATREGYSDHLPPQHITSAFGPLVPGLDVDSLDVLDMESAVQVLEKCGVSTDMYAIGRTKVFLRPGVLDELQRLRMEHIGEHAMLVQKFVRGALARILVRRLREAAARKEAERRRREEERRRVREEQERKRVEAARKEAEAKAKAEADEKARREKVQKARSLSFDRRRRKKQDEEEKRKQEEEAAREAKKAAMEEKRREADQRMRARLAAEGVTLDPASAGPSEDLGGEPVDVSELRGVFERTGFVDDEDALSRWNPDALCGDVTAQSREDWLMANKMSLRDAQLQVIHEFPEAFTALDEDDLAKRTEAAVARAEAEAAEAARANSTKLDLPESPAPGTPGGFKLNLPGTPGPRAAGGSSAQGKLLEQRRMEEVTAKFVCPLDDVFAYAEMIGMDIQEDVELLWIADEALQAPEPYGWEQRQDPRGNTYYCNAITNMTMVQHPVDYHYQQLYLQYKQQQLVALMTPRSRAAEEAKSTKSPFESGKYQLDLRSVNTDGDYGGEPPPTPKGWIKRASSMLTPRSSSVEVPPTSVYEYQCIQINAKVVRGSERLGMELNAYNQILSFQPGGPTDRHPNVWLYDRVSAVDGERLHSKLLTDVLKPRKAHAFVFERWVPPAGAFDEKRKLSPRMLLALGKARANGSSKEEARAIAEKDHGERYKKQRKKERRATTPDGPTTSRFSVTLARQAGGGLGIVADEDNVVVDMVPGTPADEQRQLETKGDPRLQIGDKIIAVDGEPISAEKPLSEVIQPQEVHLLSVERSIEAKAPAPAPPSPLSPRGLLKAITPSKSRSKKEKVEEVLAPTRALREVRIYKATEDERLGIRFVRDDDGFDRELWGREDAVTPIVAALDPKGEAARSGIEIDDMVLSINGQTGLSNTEAAAMLRELAGEIVLVLRKCEWVGQMGVSGSAQEEESTPTPLTPRSAMRRLV
jgi:hypothetical protein